jgi:DNA cross-link repair 1C protein
VSDKVPEETKTKMLLFLHNLLSTPHRPNIPLDGVKPSEQDGDINVDDVLAAIIEHIRPGRDRRTTEQGWDAEYLPTKISFPFSRHSSYHEQAHLVEVLKPKDIWPCTVSQQDWYREGGYHLPMYFGRR